MENPDLGHWNAAKRVLRYLKGITHMSLVYSRSSSQDLFTTFSDAGLGGNPDNSRSTSGFAICMGGGLFDGVVAYICFLPCVPVQHGVGIHYGREGGLRGHVDGVSP